MSERASERVSERVSSESSMSARAIERWRRRAEQTGAALHIAFALWLPCIDCVLPIRATSSSTQQAGTRAAGKAQRNATYRLVDFITGHTHTQTQRYCKNARTSRRSQTVSTQRTKTITHARAHARTLHEPLQVAHEGVEGQRGDAPPEELGGERRDRWRLPHGQQQRLRYLRILKL